MSDSERIRISEYLTQTIHIESRPVDPQLYHGQKQGEPRRYVWVRAMENIGKTLDVCLLGYQCVNLLGMNMLPIVLSFLERD